MITLHVNGQRRSSTAIRRGGKPVPRVVPTRTFSRAPPAPVLAAEWPPCRRLAPTIHLRPGGRDPGSLQTQMPKAEWQVGRHHQKASNPEGNHPVPKRPWPRFQCAPSAANCHAPGQNSCRPSALLKHDAASEPTFRHRQHECTANNLPLSGDLPAHSSPRHQAS